MENTHSENKIVAPCFFVEDSFSGRLICCSTLSLWCSWRRCGLWSLSWWQPSEWKSSRRRCGPAETAKNLSVSVMHHGGRGYCKSRWWFLNIVYFHPYLGKMNPFWRIFFRWVETTNQKCLGKLRIWQRKSRSKSWLSQVDWAENSFLYGAKTEVDICVFVLFPSFLSGLSELYHMMFY